MRRELVDEYDAPPRPMVLGGGERRTELFDIPDSFLPGKVAKIEATGIGDEGTPIQTQLSQVAAFVDKPVEIWADGDIAHARLIAADDAHRADRSSVARTRAIRSLSPSGRGRSRGCRRAAALKRGEDGS